MEIYPDGEEGGFDRTQEDDHDLLTFGEAGARLEESIQEARGRVAALEARGEDSPTLARARGRLKGLVDAAERNKRQPINDENFARFFGYEGKARRNTS